MSNGFGKLFRPYLVDCKGIGMAREISVRIGPTNSKDLSFPSQARFAYGAPMTSPTNLLVG